MKIVKSVKEMQKIRKEIEDSKKTVGFVPTMGGLHEGHLSLIKKSVSENDITISSVFLNPTQFNDKKDLETYPAVFEDDAELLKNAGVDYMFFPSYEEIYPDNYRYKISENDFSTILCGASRPGHFDGVLTVVMKLFNIVQPKNAYFGEKDFQQLTLLKGMVEAFFMNINIVPCPIVREKNGLAISSRNRKLSSKALLIAPEFHKILSDKSLNIEQKKSALEKSGFKVDYITQVKNRLYGAVFLENVRLIDNLEL